MYTVDIEDLRHLSTTLSTMASEKQKAKVINIQLVPKIWWVRGHHLVFCSTRIGMGRHTYLRMRVVCQKQRLRCSNLKQQTNCWPRVIKTEHLIIAYTLLWFLLALHNNSTSCTLNWCVASKLIIIIITPAGSQSQ